MHIQAQIAADNAEQLTALRDKLYFAYMFINLLWFIISLGVKQAQIKVTIPEGIIPEGCVKADNETDQVKTHMEPPFEKLS